MTPRKFKLAFAHFPYGGNGGTAAEVPTVRHWKERVLPWMLQDNRISGYVSKDFSDTPIPMTRNASVLWARSVGADFLIMVDSDMWPDRYLGMADAKPFLESSFDHAYKLWDTRMLCIFAPYVGPPPSEEPYVFEWKSYMGEGKDDLLKLEMMSRERAASLGGFHEVAAGPTGLMMTDMRLFDVTDPAKVSKQLEELGRDPRLEHKGWFYYEYPDVYGAEKASTEDVTFTRELSQVGITTLGYNPLVCNFDAWAAHMKPKACGKPHILAPEQINERLVTAVLKNPRRDQKLHNIDYSAGIDMSGAEVVDFDPTEEAKTGSLEAMQEAKETPRAALEPAEVIRQIGGSMVKSLGFQTSMIDLGSLAAQFKSHLIAHKAKSLRPMVAVEIGSWVGESAVAMASEGEKVTHEFSLYCVDPHVQYDDGTTFDLYGKIDGNYVNDLFHENTRGFDQIKLYRMPSSEAAKLFKRPGRQVDFLFIDGAHGRAGLELDLQSWLPKLSNRAVIAIHDFGSPCFPDVTRVVHEWFGKRAVYHPPGTQLAVVSVAEFRKGLKMGDCGPAKGAKSPPKGGPAQKKSAPKGGPLKKGK